MEKEIKYFADQQNGGLNADDADFVVGPNQVVNMENCRTGSTDRGVIGTVESVGGTRLISTPQPSITFLTIGSVSDAANNRLLFFKYNTTGPWHKIVCYEASSDTEYDVVLSSQVEGGLNFNKNYPIHSARVVAGILYWVEGENNQPRKININAGIKLNNPSYDTDVAAYTSPISQEVLTIIRKPAPFDPDIEKIEDGDFENNFIANEATQYAIRYNFRDNERSVVGPWSVLAPYNGPDDEYNCVRITYTSADFIDQDVFTADLIVRFGNTGKSFVIHTWDRADINAHNTGTQLTYDFYNDIAGIAVDDATANKPFDSVPIYSKTLEVARNRLFLGNNVEGYDTPSQSSLELASIDAEDGGDVFGTWQQFEITYDKDGVLTDVVYYVLQTGGSPSLYFWGGAGGAATPPASPSTALDLADAVYSSSSIPGMANLIANGSGIPFDHIYYYMLPYSPFTTCTLSGGAISLDGSRPFKANGSYRFSVVFYDQYRRKCGVVPIEDNLITFPGRSYDQSVYNIGASWILSNLDAAAEIPEWAYYYAIVLTKNLTTRFFTQARATQIRYVNKDDDGTYDYSVTAYSDDNYGVAIDISSLISFGLGYAFAEGDLANLYFEADITGKQELSILAQDGKWLILQLKDFGTFSTQTPLFEIYTPYKEQVDEFYYEVGQIFEITNPTTGSRTYSVISGTLNGDCYLLSRSTGASTYFAEAMSPNDKLWTQWQTDVGWPNIIDKIGQQQKTSNISYSNILINGTKVNGLSTFDALDEQNLPLESGELQKLQLTSKVQNEQGQVMLAICKNETASLYLGEVQLVASASNAFVASAPNVIGTINTLKGSFGTNNPESVCEYRGNVYWYDIMNGKVIQYSSNGLYPISNYKMTRFWKLFSDLYQSMTASEIEALGARPYVFMCVDPHHNELLISIPKLSNTPPKGYLPDYPSTIYPFDIWDAQGKTIAYDLKAAPNHYIGSYAFNPECFISLGNKLYSFLQGHLYEHNQTTNYNEFYGVQYKSKVMFVSNSLPDIPKVYDNVSVQANMKPTLTYFMSEYPYLQTSDLMDFDYRSLEGVFYASVYRNKIRPTTSGFDTDGLMTGEKMRSQVLRVMMEFTVSGATPLELKFAKVGFTPSRGHK